MVLVGGKFEVDAMLIIVGSNCNPLKRGDRGREAEAKRSKMGKV